MAFTAISLDPLTPLSLPWSLSLCGFTPYRPLWLVLPGLILLACCVLQVSLPCLRTLLEGKTSLSAKSDLSAFFWVSGTHLRVRDLRAGRDPDRAPYLDPFFGEVGQGSDFRRNTWKPDRLRNSVSGDNWSTEVLPPYMIVLTSLTLVIKTSEVE